MHLDFERLRSASAIAVIRLRDSKLVRNVELRDCNSLEIVEVPNVLYVPPLRLQIVDGHIVPNEALDEWSLEFELARDFSGKSAAFQEPFEPVVVDRRGCVLSNPFSRNFFHWITEELAKVVILEYAGYDGAYVLYEPPQFALETLEGLGIDPSRIYVCDERPVVFERAVFTTPISTAAFRTHPGLLFLLRDRLLAIARPNANGAPRLWIERNLNVNNAGRDLVDPAEIHEIVRRHGFAVIDMAEYNVSEQIAMSASAEAIAGTHGAGFVHALFMQPGSAVVECFSPAFINATDFLPIYELLNHRYAMVVHSNAYGAYPYDLRVKIDPHQLQLAFRSLELTA